MYVIEIVVRCPAQGTEIVAGGEQSAMRCMIEDYVSRALLEVLGTVIMEKVGITLAPAGWDDHFD